jgi:hypothetical protein
MIILAGNKEPIMKRISKLRLYYAASSGFILAFVPTFLLITFFAKAVTTSSHSGLLQWAIFLSCFLGITFWIYNSDAEFPLYYCMECSHEWSKRKHMGDKCPKCGSENYKLNHKHS